MIYKIGLLITGILLTAFVVGVCLLLYSISFKYYSELPEELQKEIAKRNQQSQEIRNEA